MGRNLSHGSPAGWTACTWNPWGRSQLSGISLLCSQGEDLLASSICYGDMEDPHSHFQR